MGHFSMEIYAPTGSNLNGNQQPNFSVARDIRSGALVAFSDTLPPSKRVYHLCFKKTRAHEPGLMAPAQWFKTEVADIRVKGRTESPKKRSSSTVRRASAVTGAIYKSVE